MLTSVYLRVSSDKQEKEKTIKAQKWECERFCKAKKWKYKIYKDEAFSGSMLERPGLDKLRADIKRGLIERVVCYAPDRLSRDRLHSLLLFEEFRKAKVSLEFVSVPDFSNGNDEARIIYESIWPMVAELERLRIRERFRSGRMSKVLSGKLVASIPPYGYRYIKKTEKTPGHFVIDKVEAKHVRNMFDYIASGGSVNGLVNHMNKKGIKPKKGGNTWRKSSIHRILAREMYTTGIYLFNKHESVEPPDEKKRKYAKTKKTMLRKRPKSEWIEIPLGNHLKIIELTIFNKVQEQLKKNRSHCKRNAKNQYLLSGLIVCDRCGQKYYGYRDKSRLCYICKDKFNPKKIKKGCSMGSISKKIIEPFVVERITDSLLDPQLVLEQARRYDSTSKPEIIDNTQEIKQLEDEQRRLITALQKGVVTVDQIDEPIRDIKFRLSIIQVEQNRQPEELERLTDIELAELIGELQQEIKRMRFEELKTLMQQLISEIRYNANTRRISITTHLNIARSALDSGTVVASTNHLKQGLNYRLQLQRAFIIPMVSNQHGLKQFQF